MLRTIRTGLAGLAAAACLSVVGVAAPAAATPPTAPQVATPVLSSSYSVAPKPYIVGSLTPGATVTAVAGTWSPTPTKLVYSFYKYSSSGYQILVQAGTSNKYYVKNGDNTYRLKVVVTAYRTGYTTTARASNLTLHVLLPAQRKLVPYFGGDWHDQFFKGGPTGYTERGIVLRAATHAYVEFTCTDPEFAGVTLHRERDNGQGEYLTMDRTTLATGFWLDYGSEGRLGAAKVMCDGLWTLIVRPAATAPAVYSSVSASDNHRGFIYTGPATYRTMVGYPTPDNDGLWFTQFHFGPTSFGGQTFTMGLFDSYPNAVRGWLPAGPTFLKVESQLTYSWRMY